MLRCCPNFKWYPGSFCLSGNEARCWDSKLDVSVLDVFGFPFLLENTADTWRTPVGLVY